MSYFKEEKYCLITSIKFCLPRSRCMLCRFLQSRKTAGGTLKEKQGISIEKLVLRDFGFLAALHFFVSNSYI